MKLKQRNKGFTLLETIVASTILCGSVLTITAVCSQAMANTRLNRQYETALLLADRQLSLIFSRSIHGKPPSSTRISMTFIM